MARGPDPALLADEMAEIVACFDRGLRVTWANAAAETAAGRSRAELLGRACEELGAPAEAAAAWRRELARAMETGERRVFEFEIEASRGRRCFAARVVPERDASGAVVSLVTITRDVTEDRLLPLLQTALAQLPVGVALVAAPSGRSLFRNDEASLIFRRDPAKGTVRQVSDYGAFVGFKSDGTPYEAADWPVARSILHGEVIAAEEAEILRMDGSRGYIRMSSAPVRDVEGKITAGLVTFHDISESRRADRDRAFLARASEVLGASLEPAETLRRLAALAVPALGDWCVVHIAREGRADPLAVEHRDAAKRQLAVEMSARYPVEPSGDSPVSRVLAGGAAVLIPEVTGEILEAVARDERHLEFLRALALRSVMVVPLAGRTGITGAMTFVASESGRRYSAEDLALAEDLGRRAGMAVENARLFGEEKAARRRSELLRRIAEGLSRALTAADAGRVLAAEARRAAGAAAAMVWLLDESGSHLELAAADGYSGPALDPYRRFPLDADLPLCDAVRRRAPVFLESPAARKERYPALGDGSNAGFEAWAAIPLLTHGRVLGGVSLSFAERREFGAEDGAHLAAMGLQAAQAIARARLFEAEQKARESAEILHAEAAVLYRLSDAANRTRSPEPVFEAALDAIGAMLGAERASVLLFDAAGVIRFRAWRGLSEEYRAAVEGHSPWSPETANPQAIVTPDVREDPALARFLPVFEKENIRGLAFIPLVYGQRLLGKFMVYSAEPRALDARELDRAQAIAAQVASAVGRAQGEEAMRDANRRKDEFLAMLSHELRNPLAAARNAVHLLATVPGEEAVRRRWLEVVERQTGNLVRLVDDLLDVSRITRGRIELKLERVDVTSIVQRALSASSAALAPHRVHSELPDATLAVAGDPVRLEQVFVNLLTNAGKYTAPGGQVWISARREDSFVVVRVRDAGMGIEAARLSRVFELFDQGGRDLARTQGGLGIGLTIVRGLVAMHGGRVDAASAGPGRGSEFVVRLPEAPGAAAEAARLAEAPPAEVPRRVLIVDDHVDSGEMLAAMLRAWGHVVDVVTESARAVARARDFQPDLVLLDIGLPGIDGYELARRLRADEVAGRATLVALTGYGQPADREQALASGFSKHLVKPVQPDVLRHLLGGVDPAAG